MPPLRTLANDFLMLDSDFRQFCALHGIFSVEDFIVHDIYVLVAFAERQPNSVELKKGITQVLSIIDSQHQPWLNGVELLEDARQNKHVLSTGCEGIDLLLQGGLRQGQVTELVGPSSSGKTQVCLQTTSNVAHKYMGEVMFLDTCNSFSSKRVVCFAQAEHKSHERTMRRILCHSVFDIFGLFDVLRQLESKLRSQVNRGDGRLRLLVIDSISSLITPILGSGGAHGHSLMISTGFLLKKLAYEHNLSVLVTNNTVGGDSGKSKPALGESWKGVPHVRLLLSRDQGSNLCNISVLKQTCMASGQAAKFTIKD